MNKEIVSKLVQEALDENNALFLVDLSISNNNSIRVIVDGDTGITLKECIRISRHVEHNLDREEEDFSLEVTSPDISYPLINNRQFKKNINRIMKIRTENESFEGTLVKAYEEKIILQWKAREPKPVGKGKITVEKEAVIPYGDIKEAKVKVLFN
ncbi:MAG: ribosome assembly cofactor RimP [Flavobacteriia bacterium]|nr:MAG: ribosome assembly cofactor RimP [Flavobacteriia bacterium]